MSEHRSDDVVVGPLWPLTVVLGEIACRLERNRADTHTQDSPETRHAAGSDPAVTVRAG
jgi:hypothetical protein